MKPPSARPPVCGTPVRVSDTTPEAREAMLDAVREAKGRRAVRPAETPEAAAADIETFLVVPAWAAGETAADVAADALRELYGLDASADVWTWALYAEGARRLGFPGPVPVPSVALSGTRETAPSAAA